jgi:maleylacetate reductase
MLRSFVERVPERIVFGIGSEARAAEELVSLGAERVLIVGQRRHLEGPKRVAAALADRFVGLFDGATQHVPREVAGEAVAQARELDADWIVAHGGGSTVGVAKAIALELEVAVAAIATTYSGSERTDIWGIRDGERKQTGRDPRVKPRLVIYDPALTVGLSAERSLPSALNAMAHSIEALYAADATETLRDSAEASIAPLLSGMEGIHRDPADLDARSDALYGAYLAATALSGASMALHHKLCHVLGGSFDLPHAETHSVLIPHVLAFNAPAAPDALARMQRALHASDPAATLFDAAKRLGVPTRLADLGMREEDLPRAAELAAQQRYPNPRPFDVAALEELLGRAYRGERPTISG